MIMSQLVIINKNKQKRVLIILVLSLGLNYHGYAMMPVIDIGAIAKLTSEVDEMKQQYEEMANIYKNAKDQLNEAKAIQGDAEGHYGMGNLLNSNTDLEERTYSANSWEEALKGVSGGNQARYQELVQQYQKDNPKLSSSDETKSMSQDRAKAYDQDLATNQAVTVNSSYEFTALNQHIQNLNTLSKQIESSKDSKATEDLNARLLVEVGYLQAAELRQSVLANEQLARSSASELDAETEEANFDNVKDSSHS